MFSTVAYAQQAAAQNPSLFESIIMPMLFVFMIFYFLIIRPQNKRHKKHQEFINSMKRGDSVLTSSGIFGTIEGISERFVTLEVSDGVRIRVLKSQIASSIDEDNK